MTIYDHFLPSPFYRPLSTVPFLPSTFQERKSSTKRKFLGGRSCGRPADIWKDVRGQTLSPHRSIKFFLFADVLEPKAWTSMTRRDRRTSLPSFSKSLHAWNYDFQIIQGITVTAFRGLPNELTLQLQFPFSFAKCSYRKQFPTANFENLLQLQLHYLMVFKWIIDITVTVALLFFAKRSCTKQFPTGIFKNLLHLQLHALMVFELN